METRDTIELTPVQASDWVQDELVRASGALGQSDLDTALNGYVRALGLALQLGPAPTEQVLSAVLQAARALALRHSATGLSALGPALVDLTQQVREANALPQTTVMEAWAEVVNGLGALITRLGLASALPADRRQDMLDSARSHAALLDSATDRHFELGIWVEAIALAWQGDEDEMD